MMMDNSNTATRKYYKELIKLLLLRHDRFPGGRKNITSHAVHLAAFYIHKDKS